MFQSSKAKVNMSDRNINKIINIQSLQFKGLFQQDSNQAYVLSEIIVLYAIP